MKKLIVIAAFVAVSLVGIVAVPQSALAANESIALSPTNKRYSVDPGATRSDSLKIINDGQVSYKFILYARPYSVDGEGYKPVFNGSGSRTDAYKWVQFDQTEYTLKPGESVDAKYTFTVPSNADAGGHYGVIFAETQPSDQNGGSVVRKKRVGAIVYATVNGDNKSEGSLTSTDIPFLQTVAPLAGVSRVQNTGNVDFVDSTAIKVSDVFGNEKYKNVRDLAVLPETTRKMDYTWQDGSSFGLYSVTISHDFLGKKVEKTQLVLLVPAWALVILAAAVIGLIAYKMSVKTKKRGKQSRKK